MINFNTIITIVYFYCWVELPAKNVYFVANDSRTVPSNFGYICGIFIEPDLCFDIELPDFVESESGVFRLFAANVIDEVADKRCGVFKASSGIFSGNLWDGFHNKRI